MLVVHAMAQIVIGPDGEHHDALDVLTSPAYAEWAVSADAVVDPGGRVHLLNPEPATHYTWHAGRSAWGTLPIYRGGLNHVSAGVEVLVEGALTLPQLKERMKFSLSYKPVVYRSVGWLLAKWEAELAGGDALITGHQQISGPDVRPDPKHDPGAGFAWETLVERVDEYKAAYFDG